MTNIYRNFDQQELDIQYNAQATVGDITPFVDIYEKQSANARSTLKYHDSLAFDAVDGSHPEAS